MFVRLSVRINVCCLGLSVSLLASVCVCDSLFVFKSVCMSVHLLDLSVIYAIVRLYVCLYVCLPFVLDVTGGLPVYSSGPSGTRRPIPPV
jgi:hypothetical protein